MPDGSITFDTALDNAQLEKELMRIKKKIQKINDDIYKKRQEKIPLVKQMEEVGVQLDAAKAKLEHMSSGGEFFTGSAIQRQEETVKSIQKEWDGIANKVDACDAGIQKQNISLDLQKEKAGAIEQELAAAGGRTDYMAAAAAKADAQMKKFAGRIRDLAKRVFVFTLITAALRSLRDWMGKTIKSNAEATAAVAKLKGALLTMAQPLVNIIIPAFTMFVNILTKIVSAIAGVMSFLFGTTLKASAEAAEGLYNEQKALEGVGGAAKKAGKSLASFDEINKLSGDKGAGGGGSSSSTVAPDFKGLVSDGIMGIVELFTGVALLAIGAILTFSGAHIALGIALMAVGAVAIVDAVTTNPELAAQLVQSGLNAILAVVGPLIGVVGVILTVTGHFLLGISMIVAGAALWAVGKAAGDDGDFVKNIQTRLMEAAQIIGPLIAVIGVFLTVTGHFLLGISMIISGAALWAVGSAAGNDGDFVENMKSRLIEAAQIVGPLLAVLGIFMIVTGHILLGLGMLIAGVAIFEIAGVADDNGTTLTEKIATVLKNVATVVGPLMAVLGIILLFVPGMLAVGIGMLIAGIGIFTFSAMDPDWNIILEKLKQTFSRISAWWNNTVMVKLAAARDAVANWGKGVVDKIMSVFGIHSPSTEMYAVGDYMMQGMVNGITDESPLVTTSFQAMLDSLTLTFQNWQLNFMAGFTQFQVQFRAQWTAFWSSMHLHFVYAWNNILTSLQDGINSAVSSLNRLVRAANALSGLTGKSYSAVSGITVGKIPLPKLAQGAVIPPNREFLAVLGDQKSGTNIEAPESLIRKIVREETANLGGEQTVILQLDRDQLGKVVYRLNRAESRRIGVNLAEV